MKGAEGQECNRTACQKPNSAHYYNTATYAWYCRHCATLIEEQANKDGFSFFPKLKEEKEAKIQRIEFYKK